MLLQLHQRDYYFTTIPIQAARGAADCQLDMRHNNNMNALILGTCTTGTRTPTTEHGFHDLLTPK